MYQNLYLLLSDLLNIIWGWGVINLHSPTLNSYHVTMDTSQIVCGTEIAKCVGLINIAVLNVNLIKIVI